MGAAIAYAILHFVQDHERPTGTSSDDLLDEECIADYFVPLDPYLDTHIGADCSLHGQV